MLDPVLLLLDEPSAGLAPALVEGVFQRIRDINSTGVSILLVEQNARESLRMSDRGYVLAGGVNNSRHWTAPCLTIQKSAASTRRLGRI